jgi:DNA-binding transcriptional ArsR family regulator
MTYTQALEIAINAVTDETAKEKLEALKAQLEKRGTKKTPTKTQKENEVIMERILDTLIAIGEPTTVTDLLAYGIEGFELSNQKASALLRKLRDAGKVTKTIEGKKAMFSIA